MYLSKLILNPKSNQVRKEIINPYEMHRTLLRAFPEKEAGGPGRVLFRVDVNHKTGIPVLLIQSDKEPDWSCINGKNTNYLLRTDDTNPITKNIHASFENINTRDLFHFRLQANPTKRRKDNGKRIGLYKEKEQYDWLVRKSDKAGFKILNISIIPQGIIESKKFKDDENAKRYFSVIFEGIIRVTDKQKFISTLKSGIGSAKAFGFGLLSIAPYRR